MSDASRAKGSIRMYTQIHDEKDDDDLGWTEISYTQILGLIDLTTCIICLVPVIWDQMVTELQNGQN